jgi:ribosomal protein L16 Arg81 hydroxylase
MYLKQIGSIEGLSKQQFKRDFIKTKMPVIIKDFVNESVALNKWDYNYFKQVAGDRIVEVHGSEDAHPDKVTSIPDAKMPFKEYLDLIEQNKSEARLFIFNLLLEKPELQKDLSVKKIAAGLISWLPFLFFGGEGASVRYHYDIDMSHVFLAQFKGEKKVYLFANDQSDLLYRLPYNFHGIADLRNPDYNKLPGLQYLKGWECTLKVGETLFIPSGYWHYIKYETQGYSISYRALSSSFFDKIVGFKNIFLVRRFDNTMRKLFKDKWYNYKKEVAFKRANTAIDELKRKKVLIEDANSSVRDFLNEYKSAI